MLAEMRRANDAGSDTVECRLDFLRDLPSEKDLQTIFGGSQGELIATLRPVRQGGRYDGDEGQRLDILRKCAQMGARYVDIEIDVPRQDWPDAEIILSHHDFERCPVDLDDILQRMEASDAAVNKVAFAANGPEDAFRALDFIRASQKPAMAMAMGEAGVPSRILAGKFGAFGTFASLDEKSSSAPGQLTIDEMKNLYRWDEIGPETFVCGVVGCPVAHSMSPAIHNAAFATTNIDGVYVPLLAHGGEDGEKNFRRFMDALLARKWMNWRGLSVTLPHKEHALAYLDKRNCDALAIKIGAINTITFETDAAPRGDNTDYAAAIECLCRSMSIDRANLAGSRVAVLGAGGVARSIVAGLAHCGAEVTIYNRTVSRSETLATEFACGWGPLDEAVRFDGEIIVNCTSVGMSPNVDASPLESIPHSVKVVFDTIYNPLDTRLLQAARDAGCAIVTGLDMFVNQAAAQFELWTGIDAPIDVMRNVVMEKLSEKDEC